MVFVNRFMESLRKKRKRRSERKGRYKALNNGLTGNSLSFFFSSFHSSLVIRMVSEIIKQKKGFQRPPIMDKLPIEIKERKIPKDDYWMFELRNRKCLL